MKNEKLETIISSIFLMVVLSTLFVINYTQAGMGITGCFTNIIGVLIIIIYIISRNPKYIVFFFLLNTLIGPFFIINFTFMGYPNIGRLDYFIGLLSLIKMIKEEKTLCVRKYLMILTGFVIVFWIWNIINSKANFDDAYGNVLGIGIAYAVYDSIYAVKAKKISVGNIFYYIFSFHIILSIIQLFVPVYLRKSSLEAMLKVAGFTINRPLGLLPNAYTYGISTIFALFIVYEISSENIRKKLKKQLPIILGVSIISTRAVIFGILLYMILSVAKNKRVRNLYMIILFISGCIFICYIIYNYKSVVYITDSSNASKLVLWGNCIFDYFSNLTITNLIIGRGYNSAALLVTNLSSFMAALGLNVGIDYGILSSKAFPLHNEFLQILYESGIVIFIFYILNTIKAIKYCIGKKGLSSLLISVAVTNYCLHNGFFSDILIFSIIYIFKENELKIY